MISITITDEALKDLFLTEGRELRPALVTQGIPSSATIVSSKVVGPGIMEMVWDLHDGVDEISPAQLTIESNAPACQALYEVGLLSGLGTLHDAP